MPPVDFERSVLQRSRDVPVVVDFWASWCAPCRILGPVIEDLAARSDGRWELVKLDTEAQPEIAAQYGIMAIPAVKMFHQGKVVAEFVGALPAVQIERWLESNLPSEGSDELAEIVDDWSGARGLRPPASDVTRLERFMEAHPDHALARIRLAQALVTTDPARARRLLDEAGTDADTADLSADIRALADLMRWDAPGPGTDGSAMASDGMRAALDGARESLNRADPDRLLDRLTEAVTRNRAFGDELPRRAAIAVFHLLGDDHEISRKHQRSFSMALHS